MSDIFADLDLVTVERFAGRQVSADDLPSVKIDADRFHLGSTKAWIMARLEMRNLERTRHARRRDLESRRSDGD